MTYIKIAFLTSAIAALAGCTNAQESEAQSHKMTPPTATASHSETEPVLEKRNGHKNHGYKKLTAALDFKTDFSGRSSLGVIETLNLNVINRTGGQVTYDVLDSPGLKIFKNSGFEEATASIGETRQALNLQFQPLSEGVHNLTILAKVNLPDGQFMSSTHVIPVYVGEKFQPSPKPSFRAPSAVPDNNEIGGLIVMEAEETIKD